METHYTHLNKIWTVYKPTTTTEQNLTQQSGIAKLLPHNKKSNKYQIYHGRNRTTKLDQFWFQFMHHNFTLLTKSLYMFRAPTCPSSGGQTIYTPQLVRCHLL